MINLKMPQQQQQMEPSTSFKNGEQNENEESISRENSVETFNNNNNELEFPTTKYRCLIDRINDRIKKNATFCSFEFFPPKTVNGAANLIKICDRLASTMNPLFCDITWKTGGDNCSDAPTSTMTIGSTMLSYCGIDTMMHMTCVGQSRSDIIRILNKAKILGLKNILALRGDLPHNCSSWQPVDDGFNHAIDLVRFIRKTYGDYFVICVAGYPTGHPDASSYKADLENLKAKVDAGADFIITQLFFKTSTFIKFVNDCRSIGITCPILPGIMPIQAYQSLENISRLSKLEVPQEIWDKLHAVKDNDEAVRNFGIDYAIQMCSQLLNSGVVNGLHFYTLNREYATLAILKSLGLCAVRPQRPLPWKTSANHVRCMETVRPIFWSSRPESYIYRTSGWEEFPNGRWGNSASASFRDVNEHYLYHLKSAPSKEELLKMWGAKLESEVDVWHIFECYLLAKENKQGYKVTRIPWSEGGLSSETTCMLDRLGKINKQGVLTINSQPAVNGAPSTHPIYGWGNPGGYVYQKAYLEFFTSLKYVDRLKSILNGYPNVNYHIIANHAIDITNCHELQPSALTWGVFSNMEIVQPTVYDPVAFKYWKDEAFGLWKSYWGAIYDEGSESRNVIDTIHDEYCLVNLIDNEFVKESCLFNILEEMLQTN
ncbi:hypothetical protein HELRODRAFT_111699 [Helobdella robusta]|uniref:methylenetetrahydrofolate reductase (NADPH) n=1 Tax=Helobdella robusta TaxID=6412 RepID=T1EFD8_HELRO|nr:hypothetical protein HELRODRAFT_111699 [Helobdella robusta]ESO04685.1 hypothetical protein HELRODRAFT_111699 [Helobdella robusta]